jgi:hypothetical protein
MPRGCSRRLSGCFVGSGLLCSFAVEAAES